MADSDKVIISCALTGVLANRDQCPWVPYTPVEIAAEACRAYEAGAAVVHIHAREPESGAPTFSVDIYRQIYEETRARCPVLINFSTGGLDVDIETKCAHVRAVKPELAALNMGSMNYAKYSSRRKDFVFDLVFQNPFSEIRTLLTAMRESGVKPELECFDSGHTASVDPLLDMGLLDEPLQVRYILGVVGGIPASTEALAFQKSQVPRGSTWQVIGVSHQQWRLVAAALALEGHVRVGLEDNFYLGPGEMARSNGDLVAKAARMARDVGRAPATVEEARSLLGLST